MAMRDRLAEAMDEADANVVAQVAARLQAVLHELAELDAQRPPEVSRVDELAAKRLPTADKITASGRRRNVRRA
jgi:hypothetical protein